MNHPTLLRMTAPLREDFVIPYHDVGPRDRAPKLALVAGIHGNELNGIFVLSRLASFLRELDEKPSGDRRLAGRVIVVPAVNILGVNTRSRTWPFDGTDINRMFPGYDAGETTQRIAEAVLRVTVPAEMRVDFHSSNVDFEELPQIRLYGPSEAERAMARLFALPAVIERPTGALFTATLGHAWRLNGGMNFVIQAGRAGDLQLAACEQVFRALMVFLSRTGIVSGLDLAEPDHDTHVFPLGHTFPVMSENAGLFVSELEVGAWLKAGDLLGEVFDPFLGVQQATLRAPVAGLLSGLRRQPLLCEGDLVARIQTSAAQSVRVVAHADHQ